MFRKIALITVATLALAGCGMAPVGPAAMPSDPGLSAQAAKQNLFQGLKVTSIEESLMLCPCYVLTAKAGKTKVVIDFEGSGDYLSVTTVKVDDLRADEDQLAALRPALKKAAGAMKNKDQATQVKQIAQAL